MRPSTRWRPRPGRTAWGLGLLLWATVAAQAVGQEDIEPLDRLKAAIVYKLVRFVSWPPEQLSDPQTLVLCVVGDVGVGKALALAVSKPVGTRAARLVGGADAGIDPAECHVLYVGPGYAGDLPALLRRAAAESVLTISDRDGFASRGGIIGLVRKGARIGFEINPDTARDSNLAISAQVLELATIVRNRR